MSRSSWLPVAAAVAVLVGCGASPSAEPSSSATSPSASPAVSTAPSAAPTPSASPSASAEPTPGVTVPAGVPKIGGTLTYDDDVDVTISKIENAGTTTTLTIEVNNRKGDEVTGPYVVQASYGADHLTAAPVDGGTPLTGTVPRGTKKTGTYSFTIPQASRDKVNVDVDLGPDRDHAQYKGSVE